MARTNASLWPGMSISGMTVTPCFSHSHDFAAVGLRVEFAGEAVMDDDEVSSGYASDFKTPGLVFRKVPVESVDFEM